MKKIFPAFLLLFIFFHFSYSQIKEQKDIDSLLVKLSLSKADTAKVKLYNTILFKHSNFKPQDGLKYEQPALELAIKINWKVGVALVKSNAGRLYWRMGNFEEALKRHNEALQIFEEAKDTVSVVNMLGYIGQDYADGGNYLQALDYFTKGFKLTEETHDINNQTYLCSVIAWVYGSMGNYPEGTKWNLIFLRLSEQTNNKGGIAVATANLGDYYLNMENYQQALKYFFASIDAMQDDPDNLALSYLSVGDVYKRINKPDSAGIYYNKALDLSRLRKDTAGIATAQRYIGKWQEEKGNYAEALQHYLIAIDGFRAVSNKRDLVFDLSGAAFCYTKLNKYKEANILFNEAKKMSDELKSQRVSSFYLERREVLDSSLSDWKNAYFHYKTHIYQRDSINNEETKKKGMQLTMQYQFDKKEADAKAEQEKKDILQRTIRNSIVATLGGVLIFLVIVYRQRNKIAKARKRSDELLLNILPAEVAEELKQKGSADAKQFDEVTVMFTDFKGFTKIAEKLSPTELVNEINTCFKEFDNIISKYNIEKIKTIGDAYMCAGGLPVSNKTHAEDVVKAALEIKEYMLNRLQQRKSEGKEVFEIRIGIHSGAVVAGIVGVKKFAYDIWGDTVNIASRMESSGETGKVNISGSTYELVKEKFACTYRGKIEAKNKGEVDMYFVDYKV